MTKFCPTQWFSVLYSLHGMQAKVNLARMKSPLFNTRVYTRNLENLLFRMWDRHQRHLAPAHLTKTTDVRTIS